MTEIEAKIRSLISEGEGDFNRIACELFRHQMNTNLPYYNFASLAQDDLDQIVDWRKIPPLPICAFKEVAVTTFPLSEANVVFHSSGTTSSHRSSHYYKDTSLYDLSIARGWPVKPGRRVRIYALSPTPAEAPDSSLVYMFGTLMAEFADPGSAFERDPARMAELLRHALAEKAPIWLLGTALALHEFLNFCDEAKLYFAFNERLLVMETGGFKGRESSILPALFFRRLCAVLGIPPGSILSEYSMSELSSQFYTNTSSEERIFSGPPWIRWQIVHPLTGKPVPTGQKGVLEIVDLANVHSAMAIRTEDLAFAFNGGFALGGRVPNAPAKGCSLTA